MPLRTSVTFELILSYQTDTAQAWKHADEYTVPLHDARVERGISQVIETKDVAP